MTDTVLVQTSSTEAVVIEDVNNVVVRLPEVNTVVTTAGSQGPQGPQGPQGSSGTPGAQGPQGIQGPVGPTATISTASDVDVSTLTTGSLLIYDQISGKWVSNVNLTAQYLNAGDY